MITNTPILATDTTTVRGVDSLVTGQLHLPLPDLDLFQAAQAALPGHRTPQVTFVRCPKRGSHRRLVDCWMCWCDVHAGYITLADALWDPQRIWVALAS